MRTIRRKTSNGLTVSIRYGQNAKTGKWSIFSMGNVKSGRNSVPCAFMPFELSNAVVNSEKFDTEADCERPVRSL